MKRKLLQIWGALPLSGSARWRLIYPSLQKFPVGVVAVIVNGEQEVLLFKHTYRGRFPWGLPAGWLKPGEQPAAAVVREIREETGLKAADVRILTTMNAPDARRVDLVFRCRLHDGEFRPSAEVSEMRWFSRDQLPPMLPSQYDMITSILKDLGEEFNAQF